MFKPQNKHTKRTAYEHEDNGDHYLMLIDSREAYENAFGTPINEQTAMSKSEEKVDRTRIAAMIMQGLLANALWIQSKIEYMRQKYGDNIDKCAEAMKREIAEDAVELADALIAELGENGTNGTHKD